MNQNAFYNKLIKALVRADFRLREQDISPQDTEADRAPLPSSVRMALKLTPRIFEIFTDLELPEGATDLHPFFDSRGIQNRLDRIRDYAEIVALKYVLTQPVVLCVIEADTLTNDQIVEISCQFDQVVVDMLEFSGKIGGLKIGSLHLGGTRLSATGIMLIAFSNHERASKFRNEAQDKCKIHRFWKKTWVVPWIIDLSSNEIIPHRGLPFLPGVINKDAIQKDVFANA